MCTRSAHANKPKSAYQQVVSPRGQHIYKGYHIGRLLGKGGFALCYEIRSVNEEKVNAVKIIQKQAKNHSKQEIVEKAKEQIKFLSSCDHPGIIKYLHDFQDNQNIYIILQLCSKGSLSDIMKKRKTLTQPEVRYFVAQMVEILKYIKSQRIIHRDIKLANYLIDQNYKLKLGDFGLAAINDSTFKDKKKMCGTPNYIAPEIIEKRCYGYQVDVWSTGVLIFALLYGVAPFETKCCKQTYEKIRKCQLKFQGIDKAKQCSEDAKNFISRILCLNVNQRLKIEQFMSHPFMSKYLIPRELEISFPVSPPSQAFLKKYGKPIKKNEPISANKQPQKQISPIKKMSKVSLQFKCRATYRNALQISGNTLSEQPFTPEENKLKSEQPQQKEKIFQTPVKKQVIKQQIKRQSDSFDLDQEFSSNTNGYKKFFSNSDSGFSQISTQKKNLPINSKVGMNAIVEQKQTVQSHHDDWLRRPVFSFKLKKTDRTSQNAKIDQKQTKVIYWKNYMDKYGLVYVLSNHQIGFYFTDTSKMLLVNKDEKVYYMCKRGQRSECIILNKDEIQQLRRKKDKICCKIDILYYFQAILRKQYPIQQQNNNYSIVNPPQYIKLFKIQSKFAIFKFNNLSLQYIFDDGASVFISGTTNLISYKKQEKLIIGNFPFAEQTEMDDDCKSKLKKISRYYNKILNIRNGKQMVEDETNLFWQNCQKLKVDKHNNIKCKKE